MKKVSLIIVIALSTGISSCSIFKNNSDAAFQQRMQVDAYAKANVECEYKLAKIDYSDNKDDRKLKIIARNLNTEVMAFRKEMFSRYNDVNKLQTQFNKLVNTSASNLTTCKKLKEREHNIANEKAKAEKAANKKAVNKK